MRRGPIGEDHGLLGILGQGAGVLTAGPMWFRVVDHIKRVAPTITSRCMSRALGRARTKAVLGQAQNRSLGRMK